MTVTDLPRLLTEWRLGIYSGGLLAILAVRTTLNVDDGPGVLVTGTVLTVMVATYGAERWTQSDPGTRRPGRLLAGIVGLAIGATATVAGYLAPGLVFAAGGLIFLRSGTTPAPEVAT